MRSRAVRITLTLLAVAAITAAAYHCWTIQTHTAVETQTVAAFEQTRRSALRDAYELRSAQQAYVASGQNETFWFGRVTAVMESLQPALATLRSSTTSEAARASVEEAAAAIRKFEQVDQRARNYASGGQRLLASDVIFSDGLEAAERIIAALDRAGEALAGSSRSAAAEATRQQALTAGGAAAIAVLALLLLMPAVAAPGASVKESAVEQQRAPSKNDGVGAVESELELELTADTPPRRQGQVAAMPAQQHAVDMQNVASVCTELARLADTNLLPGILERTAAALDASGLVLWIADPDGKELLPIAAHGYPASVVSRMGSLKANAENATAAAFRTGLAQTVNAGAASNGAIAVPLVTPTGCRGVMSAEVRHDSEKQPARLAAATIVAAQLATLLGPPAQAQDRSTAVL